MFHRWHFRAGQKRRYLDGKTKRDKGSKFMAIADGAGLPVAICAASASPAEVTLVHYTIEHRVVEDTPEKLIRDKAYDSDPLDRGIVWNRYDCAKSSRTEKGQSNTARSKTETIQTTMKNRTSVCLVLQLQATGCALRMRC